ncbi:MAG: hypothetical protein EXR77_12835 [Myxococcales bacterium]|nr:hypothetical protein [Myxococcales bacterium]
MANYAKFAGIFAVAEPFFGPIFGTIGANRSIFVEKLDKCTCAQTTVALSVRHCTRGKIAAHWAVGTSATSAAIVASLTT